LHYIPVLISTVLTVTREPVAYEVESMSFILDDGGHDVPSTIVSGMSLRLQIWERFGDRV
jgi:hypothetical protein